MSGYLLDTHALVWWLADDARLPATAREVIANPMSRVFVSSASIWEAGIKRALGKLDLATDVPLAEIANDEGFDPLPIPHDHAAAAADLPPHHRDPVDRMLVAQAVHENLVLVSGDEQVVRYDVPVIWSG